MLQLQQMILQNSRVDKTPPKATGEEKQKSKSDVNPNEGSSAFNISNFRANAVNLDTILPKHSFLVTFAPFSGTQKIAPVLNPYIVGQAATTMVMRCDSAQLPGVTALKDEVSRFGYGPVEDMTYGMQFADMTLGFIVDDLGTHVKFFNAWMDFITNFASKGGGNMAQKNNLGYFPYDVSYKDDYSNLQMNITVFDRSQQQVLVYELYDVFPTSVNATDVSWGDVDQLMRLYVRFAYTDFTVRVPKLDGKVPSSVLQEINKAEVRTSNPKEEVVKGPSPKFIAAFSYLGAPSGYNADPVPSKDTTYISTDANNPAPQVIDKTAGSKQVQQNSTVPAATERTVP